MFAGGTPIGGLGTGARDIHLVVVEFDGVGVEARAANFGDVSAGGGKS